MTSCRCYQQPWFAQRRYRPWVYAQVAFALRTATRGCGFVATYGCSGRWLPDDNDNLNISTHYGPHGFVSCPTPPSGFSRFAARPGCCKLQTNAFDCSTVAWHNNIWTLLDISLALINNTIFLRTSKHFMLYRPDMATYSRGLTDGALQSTHAWFIALAAHRLTRFPPPLRAVCSFRVLDGFFFFFTGLVAARLLAHASLAALSRIA